MSEPNYREMSFSAMREIEKALDILIAVQRSCEERYLSAGENGKRAEKANNSAGKGENS